MLGFLRERDLTNSERVTSLLVTKYDHLRQRNGQGAIDEAGVTSCAIGVVTTVALSKL